MPTPHEDAAKPSTRLIAATPANRSHCKALGKRGQIPLAPIREQLVDLVVERDSVFAFTYHHDLARVSLLQYRRDGAPAAVIGRHTSLGEPKGPVLTEDAAYFVRNKAVYRMARATGETVELARGVSGAIAVHGGYVYGFQCTAKTPPDQLLRISARDGNVERLATIERGKPREQDGAGVPCDYVSVLADEQAVYAANWFGRHVLRIALADRSVTELVTKTTFPSHLAFDAGSILFQAGTGLYRVSTTEANATRISEIGSAPFTLVAHQGPTTYVHQGEPYAPEEWTYELDRATGKASKIQSYKAIDPDAVPPDTGIRSIAVDDECVYTARQLKSGFSLFARSRG